jgi:sec-independent protein translocase protein TatA
VAKGIKAFKKGMSDDETPAPTAAPTPTTELPRTLEHQPAPPSTAATSTLADRKIG